MTEPRVPDVGWCAVHGVTHVEDCRCIEPVMGVPCGIVATGPGASQALELYVTARAKTAVAESEARVQAVVESVDRQEQETRRAWDWFAAAALQRRERHFVTDQESGTSREVDGAPLSPWAAGLIADDMLSQRSSRFPGGSP